MNITASTTAVTTSARKIISFNPSAAGDALRLLETTGLRIAHACDFNHVQMPKDFDGADGLYCERIGIVSVRYDPDQLDSTLSRALQKKLLTEYHSEISFTRIASKKTVAPSDRRLKKKRPTAPASSQSSNGNQDSYDETGATWGLQAIKANSSSLTGAGIKVAVLDSGFDEQHPDFIGRRVTKRLFATDSSEADISGHGTHCIGTIFGPALPASGPRYGIAPDAEIYAGKIFDDTTSRATETVILCGINWALHEGCAVISLSAGEMVSPGDLPKQCYEQIGQACLDAGSLLIAAAGDFSDRPFGFISPVASPANASTIMAVGAVDKKMQVTWVSCGSINPNQNIDLVAPGEDILSSYLNGGYFHWAGTSMSVPHVAGVAALIVQSDSQCRGKALWTRLLQSARPLNLPVSDVGSGLVQAPL